MLKKSNKLKDVIEFIIVLGAFGGLAAAVLYSDSINADTDKLFDLFFLVTTFVLMIFTLLILPRVRKAKIQRCSMKTTAVVADYETRYIEPSQRKDELTTNYGSTSYHAILEYTVGNVTKRYTSPFPNRFPNRVGHIKTIYVNPNNPNELIEPGYEHLNWIQHAVRIGSVILFIQALIGFIQHRIR